jgi:hypothetical protein
LAVVAAGGEGPRALWDNKPVGFVRRSIEPEQAMGFG